MSEAQHEPDDSPVAPGSGPSPTEAARAGTAASELDALVRACFRITLVLCALLLAARLAAKFRVESLWDDAYFFQRYAQHLLAGEGLVWNSGGEATYGLTAPLFLVPATLLRVLTGGQPALAALLASTVCGVVFLALCALLVIRVCPGGPNVKRGAALLLAICLVHSVTPEHFASGMDATFALAYLAGYLLAIQRLGQRPGWAAAIGVGLLGGLAFWARPELLSYALLCPLSLLVLSRDPGLRRRVASALAVTVALTVAIAIVNTAYFHSTLPLPFYAKSTEIYGAKIFRFYRGATTKQLIGFVASYWPLVAVVAADLVGVRRYWRESSPLEKSVLGATLVYVGYHWLVALPVMGFWYRLYLPTLAALFFLFCHSLPRVVGRLRPSLADVPRSVSRAGACAGMVLVWTALVPLLSEAGQVVAEDVGRRRYVYDVTRHARRHPPKVYWFALERFSALPDDLVIATTEVGLPAVVSPGKVIIDLSGLNERAFSHQPFDPAVLFSRYRPDLIYLPHPNYRRMAQALEKDPIFQEQYQAYPKEALGVEHFGIALWKGSSHFQKMRDIVRAPRK